MSQAKGRAMTEAMKLHKLCREGKLSKIREFLDGVDKKSIEEMLASRSGAFGYTLLHETVASGNSEILNVLLGMAGDVNCRAGSGYTPLHLAASSGDVACAKVLLNHNADITATDEYGKTPKQTAELSSKNSTVKLLRSEGVYRSHTGLTAACTCMHICVLNLAYFRRRVLGHSYFTVYLWYTYDIAATPVTNHC